MVETGLANAGLFCLPEKQSIKEKPMRDCGARKSRPAYCSNCQCFHNGECDFGFYECSFKGFPLTEKKKSVQRQKCPENCTYPRDGFCMGICMRKILADHRKRWKYRHQMTEGENR